MTDTTLTMHQLDSLASALDVETIILTNADGANPREVGNTTFMKHVVLELGVSVETARRIVYILIDMERVVLTELYRVALPDSDDTERIGEAEAELIYGITVQKPGGEVEINPFGGYDSAWSAYVDWQRDEPNSTIGFVSREAVYSKWTVHPDPVYGTAKVN